MSDWISVDERLPSLDGLEDYQCGVEVLVSDGKTVTCARWETNKYARTEKGKTPRWEKSGRIYYGRVTHWQLLPEPPK